MSDGEREVLLEVQQHELEEKAERGARDDQYRKEISHARPKKWWQFWRR
jgi:hypothetical protein